MRHNPLIWDMTHSYGPCMIHIRRDSCICDTTHSYVMWFIHVRCNSFLRDTTHSYATWLIHMLHYWFIYDMTHSYATRPIHTQYPSCIHTCMFIQYIHIDIHHMYIHSVSWMDTHIDIHFFTHIDIHSVSLMHLQYNNSFIFNTSH